MIRCNKDQSNDPCYPTSSIFFQRQTSKQTTNKTFEIYTEI